MSHLSNALQPYYERQGSRIVFQNGWSLNRLALAMWEHLGFRQIDASVLSRVLKGERLLNAEQIDAFGALLGLPGHELRVLHAALSEDLSARLHVAIGSSVFQPQLVEAVADELAKDAFTLFYQGDYSTLLAKHELIGQLVQATEADGGPSRQLISAFGASLYLNARTAANGEPPDTVVAKVQPTYARLLALSRRYAAPLLYGYANILMCNAYYLAGGYATARAHQPYYRKSIHFAWRAIGSLPRYNHERLFALRSMAASAYYLQDAETMAYVMGEAKHILPQQPDENYINALHLSSTLSKGSVLLRQPNPFLVHETALNRFRAGLAHTGVYEVSGIKDEVDTLFLMKTSDTAYIQKRLLRGLALAEQYGFERQKKHFSNVLQSL